MPLGPFRVVIVYLSFAKTANMEPAVTAVVLVANSNALEYKGDIISIEAAATAKQIVTTEQTIKIHITTHVDVFI